MARYLVTGAAGFIGANVAEKLLDAGDEVTGVDNLNDAYDPRLKHWRLGRLEDKPGFDFQRLDICDRAALGPLFAAKFDAVINLAARAGVRQSTENPWVYIDTNVTGTLNLLEACREAAVEKFLLASTSSLYGDSGHQPFREDADTDAPLSPYAASKKAAEALTHTYHHLYGIDASVLRFFTVYGPAGRPDMSLFRFVQWISEGRPVTVFGDGSQSRDFTYVDDVAEGVVAALKPLNYEVINLGSDQPVVLMDVIRMVEDLTGKKADIRYEERHSADVLATWADITKAKRLLGWEPGFDMATGLGRLVDWYRDNRDWAKDVVTA